MPDHLALEEMMGEQVEWFSCKARNLIGTIALTRVGRSWNYAVLGQNTLGHWRVCAVGQNFFNRTQSIAQFNFAMLRAKHIQLQARRGVDR